MNFNFNHTPDFVIASGTENELRIGASGVTFKGATISDAGEAYRALMAAMNRPAAAPVPASTGRDCRAVCQASKMDGIACPPDSCDYEDGTRVPVAIREPECPRCPKQTAYGPAHCSDCVAARELDVESDHLAAIEEAMQVLESGAAHNESKGRTVLVHTQKGRAARLRAAHAYFAARSAAQGTQAESAPGRGPRYTCIGKGGDYELIGEARGAGKSKLIEPLAVYRDTATGRLFFRTTDDFNERMAPSPNSPVGGKDKDQ